MRFNIVSNLNNGHGLQREWELLRYELERCGHTVQGVQFNDPRNVRPAEVNLFVETVVPSVFEHGMQQWVMPHPEWWLAEYHACLPYIQQVLCKTHDCQRLFTNLVGDRATYIGFMSGDHCRPDIWREDRFLHVAGKSAVKNTEAILEAWKTLPFPLELVTSLRHLIVKAQQLPNVTVYPWLKDDDLTVLYNRCRFHLCPSQYEGYGHCLHEGLGVGAIIVTVNAPPMNEFGTPPELLLQSIAGGTMRLATLSKVSPQNIVDIVQFAMQLSHERLQELSLQARQTFEFNRQEFRVNFAHLIERVWS